MAEKTFRDGVEAMMGYVFTLCEDTAERFNSDREGGSAFAAGRIAEAKSIARTIGNVGRELIDREDQR